MSRVRNVGTQPEMTVRRMVHGMGYRYSLHSNKLPGKPDITLTSRKKVIFVHGCFWHQHGCNHYCMPRTRKDFWKPKLEQNKKRDIKVRSALNKLGWKSLVVWECQIKKADMLREKIRRFLEA